MKHCGIHWPDSDVRPNPPVDNATDERFTYVESLSSLPLECATSNHASNLQHVVLGQFGAAMTRTLRTEWRPVSTLPDGIEQVVSMRPEKQMIGAYTATIVTVMTDQETVSNWTNGNHVGEAMGTRPAGVSESELAIAVANIDGAAPLPAFARFVDRGPEASDSGSAILMLHREPLTRGVMPSAVCTGARASVWRFYHA